ncbi:MAG: YkvA family protein [Paracoccus sp. (in: a-proteobacteria)]
MTDKGNGSVPEYEEKGFLDKVKGYGRAIGRPALEKAFLAYHVLRDPDTPAKAKAILGGSLAYLVMPVDAISDFLPVVGYTDDLAVLGARRPWSSPISSTSIMSRPRLRSPTFLARPPEGSAE